MSQLPSTSIVDFTNRHTGLFDQHSRVATSAMPYRKSPLLELNRKSNAAQFALVLFVAMYMADIFAINARTIAQDTSSTGTDTVFVIDRKTNQSKGRPGSIVDFTDRYLELQTPEGRAVKIPAADVDRIQTTYSESYQSARNRLAAGDFEPAMELLNQALREEKREWALREILAERTSVAKLLGDSTLACESFLLIARNTSNHRHWAVTPLPWRVEAADIQLEQRATEWLNSSKPAEQLVGASWLLQGPRAKEAEAKLKELSRNRTDKIGQLASVQLWRLPRTMTKELVVQWQTSLQKLPDDLRPGPEFLLGRAHAQLKQYDQAAVSFLRIRILHPECYELSAMSLFEASRALQTSGRVDEAARVTRELKQAFPDSFWSKQSSN